MRLTNRPAPTRCPAGASLARYCRRGAVETHYRAEKPSLDIETFQRQPENGRRQEWFALLIMAVIARIWRALMTDPDHPAVAEPQFNHARITLAEEAFVLTPRCPELALVIFSDLLPDIARVRSYRLKTPRPSPPRVCTKPVKKGQLDQSKRLASR